MSPIFVLVTELPLPYSLSLAPIILSVVLKQVTTKKTLVSIAVSDVCMVLQNVETSADWGGKVRELTGLIAWMVFSHQPVRTAANTRTQAAIVIDRV